jgi:hypothetical protein
MSHLFRSNLEPAETIVYQIRIKGHLEPQSSEWFDGLSIALEEDEITLLTGPRGGGLDLKGKPEPC